MNKPEESQLVAYLANQLKSDEHKQVEAWIEASAENKAEFARIQKIWENHGHVANTFQPDEPQAWTNIQARIDSHPSLLSWNWVVKVAAVMLLALGLSYYFLGNESGRLAASKQVEFVAESSIEKIELPDGSIIHLNQGSKVSFDPEFAGKDRIVSLVGEAFFDVARDEKRPFIIDTESTRTEVLGTSFVIKEDGNKTMLTVVSGKVRFAAGPTEGKIFLKGDRGLFENGQISKTRNLDINFMSWQTGQIVFKNSPLPQVIADLERHYQVSFTLEAKSSLKLTSKFDNQPLSEVISIISATLDVKIAEEGEGQYIIF